MADGRSGKMIKRVTPVYDPPIRISYFSEGQEQEAINSYRRGNITLYKGALLVPLLFFPSSYAFGGMIHLKDDDSLNITTLKHESGHISQERILGPKKYVASIGIPSLIGYALDYFGIIPPNVYFNLPWERGADLRSNVHRTTHVRGSDTFATIYELLSILMP